MTHCTEDATALADLIVPFEGFWVSAFARLHVADLSAAAAVSRQLHAGAMVAAESALAQLFAPLRVRRPPGVSWVSCLRRAVERPRFVVAGGEDAADMPQLHLSMVTLHYDDVSGACKARHERLPPSGASGGCSLPSGRYRLSACRMGPMVYFAGGTGPEGDPCPQVLAFNTISHRWDDGATVPRPEPMPTPRYGHEVVGVLGRYLLCIGGKAAGVRESPEGQDTLVGGSADVLDVVTGRWAQLPSRLEDPRVYFGAAVVVDDATGITSVVVCGGAREPVSQGSEGRLASTEFLDVSRLPELFGDPARAPEGGAGCAAAGEELPPLRWRVGPPLKFPRYDCSLAGPMCGRLFAIGGSGARRSVEVLETACLLQRVLAGAPPRWELHPAELPERCLARSGSITVAVGQHLVLAGGSQKPMLRFGPAHGGCEQAVATWQWSELEGAELDTMRLGAKVVAFGPVTC